MLLEDPCMFTVLQLGSAGLPEHLDLDLCQSVKLANFPELRCSLRRSSARGHIRQSARSGDALWMSTCFVFDQSKVLAGAGATFPMLGSGRVLLRLEKAAQ